MKTTPPPPAPIKLPPLPPRASPTQRKYLNSRLSRAIGNVRYSYGNEKMPPKVRAAYKVIARWNSQQNKARRAHEARVERADAFARQKILFGTPDEALAGVVSVEAQFARKRRV